MDNQSSGTDVDAQLHVNQYIIPMLASGTKFRHDGDYTFILKCMLNVKSGWWGLRQCDNYFCITFSEAQFQIQPVQHITTIGKRVVIWANLY